MPETGTYGWRRGRRAGRYARILRHCLPKGAATATASLPLPPLGPYSTVDAPGTGGKEHLAEVGLLLLKPGETARVPQPSALKEVQWIRTKPAPSRASNGR
jgi:hypothetical protein